MAQCDSLARIRGLKLETHPDEQRRSSSSNHAGHGHSRRQRPPFHGPFASEDTIRACATPPIGIPGQYDETSPTDDAEALNDSELYINQFLRDRETSLQFQDDADKAVGHRHHHIPLKPPKRAGQNATRGRSLAHALSEYRAARAHSESDRSHYDPQTGRHLSQYSDSPPKDEPHVGEARFPLLQETVDALARRSIDQPMSMTSESTVSPVEEAVATPSDISGPSYISAPINISPGLVRHFSTSYESPRARSQRKASERWRDGEAAQDFFSRAGSLKKSDRGSARRSARRDTQSTKSPHSAASSFLRGFSISSATEDAGPPPVDAEGATVGEDYVLGKQIGFGGFSVIREVKQMSAQTGEQRTLAVKIVRKHIEGKTKTENDVAQAEFEHEIDLWRLLNHKHILGLEAVYELKEATFCFVPLNTGGTLFDLINNNRQGLPPELVANYSYQLASALRYLHLDARVVHRDIKLENCLIDTTHGDPGLLRVCDFGLAEWLSSDSDSATSGSPSSASERERTVNKYFGPAESSTSAFAGGSLEYAAPEILRIATTSSGRIGPDDIPPEKTIVSSAVDIWAMGVCMYALLMGRRPFQDNFRPRVVMAILAGDWPKHALKDKAGVQPYSLVKSCLTMDATQRPGISEVIQNAWFDEARSSAESSDAESEGARASVWRL